MINYFRLYRMPLIYHRKLISHRYFCLNLGCLLQYDISPRVGLQQVESEFGFWIVFLKDYVQTQSCRDIYISFPHNFVFFLELSIYSFLAFGDYLCFMTGVIFDKFNVLVYESCFLVRDSQNSFARARTFLSISILGEISSGY